MSFAQVDLLSVIVHDTFVIVAVTEDVLCLYDCERSYLVGKSIFDLVPDADMRSLARLRMRVIREKGGMKPQELPMLRPDGSIFWIISHTREIRDGYYWSTIQYIGEHNPRRRLT